MSELGQMSRALAHWFARHNISTDPVTIILNVADRDAAMRLDHALRQEFDALILPPMARDIRPRDISRFQLMGLKFQIESPLHVLPGKVP